MRAKVKRTGHRSGVQGTTARRGILGLSIGLGSLLLLNACALNGATRATSDEVGSATQYTVGTNATFCASGTCPAKDELVPVEFCCLDPDASNCDTDPAADPDEELVWVTSHCNDRHLPEGPGADEVFRANLLLTVAGLIAFRADILEARDELQEFSSRLPAHPHHTNWLVTIQMLNDVLDMLWIDLFTAGIDANNQQELDGNSRNQTPAWVPYWHYQAALTGQWFFTTASRKLWELAVYTFRGYTSCAPEA